MSTLHKILLPLVCLALLMSGCQPKSSADILESFVTSDESSVLFDKAGGVARISVIASSSDWTIEKGHPDWINASKDGKSLIITAQPNDGSDERLGALVVALGKATKSFTIHQAGTAPQLRVEDVEHVFKKEGGQATIEIFVNSEHWTVSKVHDAPWLTYEADLVGKKLTIRVPELREDEEGGKDSRRASLVVSNGSQHVKVNVTQLGWQQFTEGVSMIGKTRQEIIDFEKSLGHERDLEAEKEYFYPKGQAIEKDHMVFKTTAQQAPYTVYSFHYDNNNVCEDFYYKADFGGVFDTDMLDEWMTSQGFKKGEGDPAKPEELYYYKDDGEHTAYYEVINKKDAITQGYMPRSAIMRFNALSNQLQVDPKNNRIILNFPLRNTARFYDMSYTLKEVIEYEKRFGMTLDPNHKNTVKCKIAGYEHLYESVAFVRETPRKAPGDCQLTVYFFNIPGVIDEATGLPASNISHDPALAGSVGSRSDIYSDARLAYRITSQYFLSTSLQKAYKRAGFGLASGDSWYGVYYFIRGVEDVAYIQAMGEPLFSMTFFRSKELVDSYREGKGGNN